MSTTQIINLKRYPLDKSNTAEARELVHWVRSRLDSDGSCTLENFVCDEALLQMAAEANTLIDAAYRGPTEVSPYFFNYRIAEGMDVDPAHPVKRLGKRNLSQVAADLIPSEHALSQLYQSPLMTDFLTAVLGAPVYRNADKYQSLNISVMEEGGCQQWHFDGGNMVTTLLLQEPEAGGAFEYVPEIRSDTDENFEAVRGVLDGNRSAVRKLALKAGTLSLFRGHYSLHRVTEVIGKRHRLQAILGYTTQKHFVGSHASSVLHYGDRVASNEGSKDAHQSRS